MSKDFQKYYEDRMITFDDEAAEVEDILGDVSDSPFTDTEAELAKARLENIIARTKILNEKLSARKKELFDEWNEAFYDEFVKAFSKFKNCLIDLHLDEAQLKIVQDKLESSLVLMEEKLESMYSDFISEDEES